MGGTRAPGWSKMSYVMAVNSGDKSVDLLKALLPAFCPKNGAQGEPFARRLCVAPYSGRQATGVELVHACARTCWPSWSSACPRAAASWIRLSGVQTRLRRASFVFFPFVLSLSFPLNFVVTPCVFGSVAKQFVVPSTLFANQECIGWLSLRFH